jgi:hypothetical protein
MSAPKSTDNWRLLWFCRLEHALERGDYAAAAAAQHRLLLLGVDVKYRPAHLTREVTHATKR